MQRIPLASTALASVGYDAATCELEVEFRSGRIYRYREVPPGTYDFLLRARHKGQYFNRMIANRYAFEEVGEAAPEQDILGALQASLDRSSKAGR